MAAATAPVDRSTDSRPAGDKPPSAINNRVVESTPIAWLHYPMAFCPDDEFGPMASAWSWPLGLDERSLDHIDLEGRGTRFGLLAEYEGKSILFKVVDTASDETVGVIKTDSSNTRTEGEVFAYRLARLLGFGELVAPTLPVQLRGGALRKVHRLLAEVSYRDGVKESARQQVLRRIGEALADGGSFPAAIKPWLKGFMFNGTLGRRESLGRQPVQQQLRATGPWPGGQSVMLSQTTRLYSPPGTHRGSMTERQLAADLSNIMFLDAVTGQIDRFAGGNLHFRSIAGRADPADGESPEDATTWELGQVRLLALDNGGSLRYPAKGLNDLRGRIDPGTRVERFDRWTIERARALSRRTSGVGCGRAAYASERQAAWRELGLSPLYFDTAARHLTATLEYVRQLELSHGEAIYLPAPER